MKKMIVFLIILISVTLFSDNPKDGIYEQTRILTSYTVKEVDVNGDIMAAACDYDGFMVYDISSRTTPVLLGGMDTYRALDVYCDSKYVYVADYSGGFKIYDYSDTSNIHMTGSITDSINEARRITVSGNYAYIGGGGKGLQIVDITDRDSPVYIGRYPIFSGSARKIWVKDSIAYMATESGGINIINISNPHIPALISNIPCEWINDDVYVEDFYLYATDADSGIVIYDISNPASPVLIDKYRPVYYPACRLFKLYDVLYVSEFAYIEAIDISNKSNPVSLAYCSAYWSIGLDVSSDGYIYSAEDYDGLGIYSSTMTGIDSRKVEQNNELNSKLMSACITDNELHLYFNSDNENVSISMIDKLGRKVFSVLLESVSGRENVSIPIRYPAGEYFINAYIGNTRICKKIIIVE